MVQRNNRRELALPAEGDHLAVVRHLELIEETVFWLDAGPLDREAVRVEAETLQYRHVARVAGVVVDGRAAGLLARRPTPKLPRPPVAVRVIALDLVCGRGGAPEEFVGKSQFAHRWAA